jgi:hypothetical protein
MLRSLKTSLLTVILVATPPFSAAGFAQTPLTPAFTYQGRLLQSGSPVNGTVNLAFFLYNALSGGSQVGNSVVLNNQSVQAGLFTAALNSSGEFGPGAFGGDRRWLEVWVNGVPLSPRQELTVTPNAQFAINTLWTGLIGVPPVAMLNTAQTFTARPTFSAGITTNSLSLPSNPQAGYVLTSDASGNGTWQQIPTPSPPNALVPVAGIVAWHKSIPGAPPSLPDGWLECNGQTVTDSASPLNGQLLPNLNGDGRFLRGSASSGTMQADDFKSHSHAMNGTNVDIVTVVPSGGDQTIPHGGGGGLFGATTGTASTGGSETRPVNMSVVWIIRIK